VRRFEDFGNGERRNSQRDLFSKPLRKKRRVGKKDKVVGATRSSLVTRVKTKTMGAGDEFRTT